MRFLRRRCASSTLWRSEKSRASHEMYPISTMLNIRQKRRNMAAKRKRIARSKDDLRRELREQFLLLKNSCRSFDDGLHPVAKHIALNLRVLLYHHRQSRSLLEQLSLRNCRFYDTAGKLNSNNLFSECNLVVLQAKTTHSGIVRTYLAKVTTGFPEEGIKKIRFPDWWNRPVVKDTHGKKFCRRELVLNVANTDGGAHVDPSLDEKYMDLSRKNSLGWYFMSGNIEEEFSERPELACIRQIAHEVLKTMKEKVPSLNFV